MALPFDFTTGALPSGVTASGGTNGRRFNSSGVLVANAAPRFDYTTAGVSRGLLVEPAATSIIISSNNFDAIWSPNQTLATGTATGLDGTSWKTITATGQSAWAYYEFIPLASATAYVWSIYLKKISGSGSSFILGSDGAGATITFDLDTNTFTGADGNIVATGYEDLGSGWLRIWGLTNTSMPSGSQGFIVVVLNGNATVAFGYAQAEPASKMSSPILTTTSAVTRAADAISFTIPAGVTSLVYTFDDNSTQTVTGLTPGASYTIPTTLNRARIKTIADPNAGGGSVTGTLAATEASDTFAATGQLGVLGSWAATEARDTFAGAGVVAWRATWASTEASDTFAASGLTAAFGTLAATEAPDTFAGSGTVSSGIAGTLAATEARDTFAASGGVIVSGSWAATEQPDTFTASGSITTPITGTLAATEPADTFAATGAVLFPITGSWASTEPRDVFAGVGVSTVAATTETTIVVPAEAQAGRAEPFPIIFAQAEPSVLICSEPRQRVLP